MAAPLSVIIPTLNSAPQLQGLLEALIEGVQDGLVREVIFTDGGSTDDTAQLAQALGARMLTGEAGRGQQLARGVEASRGAWLLVLHADTHLPADWVEDVLRHMHHAPELAMVFRLRYRARGVGARGVAAWANLRTRLFGLPYGDQGLLISRALYDEVGGYAPISLMEDVALARALKGRFVLSPLAVTTSSSRYQKRGWFWQGGRNLWLLVRYLLGADPEHLAKAYRR